jgi:hypothetical protein
LIRSSGQVVQDRRSPVVGWAVLQSCLRASGAVQRLGYSRDGTGLILDRLLFE